jgi:hypothetical protein
MKKYTGLFIVTLVLFNSGYAGLFSPCNVKIRVTNNSNVILKPMVISGSNMSTDKDPVMKMMTSPGLLYLDMQPGSRYEFYTEGSDFGDDACGTLTIVATASATSFSESGKIYIDYCNPFVGKSHYYVRDNGILKAEITRRETGYEPQQIDITISGNIVPKSSESYDFFQIQANEFNIITGTIEWKYEYGLPVLTNTNEVFKWHAESPRYFITNDNGSSTYDGKKGSYQFWLSNYMCQKARFKKTSPYCDLNDAFINLNKETPGIEGSYVFKYTIYNPRPQPFKDFEIYLDKNVDWSPGEGHKIPPKKEGYKYSMMVFPKNESHPIIQGAESYNNNVFTCNLICMGVWIDMATGNAYDLNGNNINALVLKNKGMEIYKDDIWQTNQYKTQIRTIRQSSLIKNDRLIDKKDGINIIKTPEQSNSTKIKTQINTPLKTIVPIQKKINMQQKVAVKKDRK